MALTIYFGTESYIEGNIKHADNVKCSKRGDIYYRNDLKLENNESCTEIYPNVLPFICEKNFKLEGTVNFKEITNIVAIVENSSIGDTAKITIKRASQLSTFLFISKSSKVSTHANFFGFDHIIYFDKSNIDTFLEKYGEPITPSIISLLKEFV